MISRTRAKKARFRSVLGPQATLDRGYAIVRRRGDGAIVRRPDDAAAGTTLRISLADGTLAATSDGPGGAGEQA